MLAPAVALLDHIEVAGHRMPDQATVEAALQVYLAAKEEAGNLDDHSRHLIEASVTAILGVRRIVNDIMQSVVDQAEAITKEA